MKFQIALMRLLRVRGDVKAMGMLENMVTNSQRIYAGLDQLEKEVERANNDLRFGTKLYSRQLPANNGYSCFPGLLVSLDPISKEDITPKSRHDVAIVYCSLTRYKDQEEDLDDPEWRPKTYLQYMVVPTRQARKMAPIGSPGSKKVDHDHKEALRETFATLDGNWPAVKWPVIDLNNLVIDNEKRIEND